MTRVSDSCKMSFNLAQPRPCLAPFSIPIKIKTPSKMAPFGTVSRLSTGVQVFHGGFLPPANHLPGCCWLVGLRCVNGSPHMAAASFRANLLNLMDSEKASGLRVLALPTPCFLFLLPLFVSSSPIYSAPIDYQNFLANTRLRYLFSSARLCRSDCWRFSSALSKQVWSLTKVRGCSSLCSSTAEVNGERSCVPGTRFLQHTVTSLQLSPSLMLPDRWGCV